jgi:hypothetical protein
VQRVLGDVRELERERRVVGDHGRVGRRDQQRVAVLVLQALAVERGPPGGGAEQEAAGSTGRPQPTARRPVRWKPNIE